VTGAFVGLDIGGTKVAAAALHDGELSDWLLRPTELSNGDVLIDQLAELVHEAKPGEVDGVGIGVPSVVEFRTGRVVSSINVPLADVPLRQVLGERLGVPVFVDNDAAVAALAEAHDEHLRLVSRHLVMLTVGTGVGGGLVLGGHIYRGSTGGAGEIGHTVVGLHLEGEDPVPTGDAFPQPGSLEAVAAGQALDRLAIETAKLYPDSALGQAGAQGHGPTGVDAVDAAKAGDEDARRTVQAWAERVGIGIANAINTFDPDEVVIGGGGIRAGDLLLEPVTRVAQAYVHPGLAGHARIRLARHGLRAGVLGAALLALDEVEQESAEQRRLITEPNRPEVCGR
jgi:glucokinase